MANIGEKAIPILAGNLNSGLSYPIPITVTLLVRAHQYSARKVILIYPSNDFLGKLNIC